MSPIPPLIHLNVPTTGSSTGVGGRRIPATGDRAAAWASASAVDNASSTDAAAGRRPTTSRGLQYIPSKAVACMHCADCKQRPLNASTPKTDRKCAKACKLCPDNVLLGAEKTISVEVDGIVATKYVRLDGGAGGQGRALQSSDFGNGVQITQTATTIFEGAWTPVGA